MSTILYIMGYFIHPNPKDDKGINKESVGLIVYCVEALVSLESNKQYPTPATIYF